MSSKPVAGSVRQLNVQALGLSRKYRETLAILFFDYQSETDGLDGDKVISAWAERLHQAIEDEVCRGWRRPSVFLAKA